MPVPFFIQGLARGHLGIRGRRATLSPLSSFFQRGGGGGGCGSLLPHHLIFWGISQRRRALSLKNTQFLHGGVGFHFFRILTPLSNRHLWVLSISLNTSVASFTESLTKPVLFLSIPCWITLRALANFSISSFCSFRSWRTSSHPSAPGEAPKSTFPTIFSFFSINLFTSASSVEERVEIVGNGCTLGPKSYPSSLRSDLRLAGPGIHGHTGLARGNRGSDTCVQYALPDQGPEGADFWSRMAHHLGGARLTATSPPRGPGKTPLGD